MYIIYAFSIILLIRVIYKAFFTKLETVVDYHQRAFNYVNYFQNRTMAINLLEQALSMDKFNNVEKASFHLKIGILYFKMKKFEEAKESFENILSYIRSENFSYTKELSAIVLTYYNLGEKDKARKIYHWLLSKEKYDPDFSNLRYLDTYIWK